MAELTTIEEKLAEVTGLAMAAQGAAEKVSGLVDDEELQTDARSDERRGQGDRGALHGARG